jgi:hypothetical protein
MSIGNFWRFGRRGTQSGRRLAVSRRSRTLAQAGNGGAQAHSGIPAWQRYDFPDAFLEYQKNQPGTEP